MRPESQQGHSSNRASTSTSEQPTYTPSPPVVLSTSPSNPPRMEAGPNQGPRRDTIAAERSLLAGNSANTLKTKFNKDVLVELCTARALPVTGTKDDLIKRLIAWVSNVALRATD